MTLYRESAAPPRACPRCSMALDEREVADAVLDVCDACHGVFVRRDVLPRLLDPIDLGMEITAIFPRGAPSALYPGPLYIACPFCGQLMNRKLFATGAKVIIDECKAHGVWFDADELRAVVDFAAGGGLTRAAEAEARRREKEEHARAIRAEQASHEAYVHGDDYGLVELIRDIVRLIQR